MVGSFLDENERDGGVKKKLEEEGVTERRGVMSIGTNKGRGAMYKAENLGTMLRNLVEVVSRRINLHDWGNEASDSLHDTYVACNLARKLHCCSFGNIGHQNRPMKATQPHESIETLRPI